MNTTMKIYLKIENRQFEYFIHAIGNNGYRMSKLIIHCYSVFNAVAIRLGKGKYVKKFL